MHYQCLIVDDEAELAKMTAEYFQMFDVTTAVAESAAACYEFFKDNTAELILLDINLGDGSGFSVCRKLREEYNLPILFISARQSDDDVLAALSIGGDDYIKKPYSLSVLLAKVKVNLKRVGELKAAQAAEKAAQGTAGSADGASNGAAVSGRADGQQDSADAITLDPATMSVLRRGERIPLKAKEFALLSCLYEHKNTIVTKEVLFEEVWGDTFYGDGTLNVHIRKLREKLEDDPNAPTMIKTVWGTGYILEL
ncbi:MAG: response regulator transcription factor [Lachnospiraceae bacterium]|nr:response regulator transcription factor [Lachnospiraceae bacterium]